MKLLISPAVSQMRLDKIRAVVPHAEVVNAQTEDEALRGVVDADAMFGYLTLPLLRAATKLRWVQSPTASMEKYLYPELVASPVLVSNMRGIFSDVIADHVFAYVLCFAKNFPTYFRQQQQHHWQMLGREAGELPGYAGPGEVHPSDCATITLGDCTLGIVGYGGIGRAVASRGQAFGMRVLAVDPQPGPPDADTGVALYPPEQLDEVLGQSDFVVVTAPHTPETYKLFTRGRFRRMRPTAYFINVGRGVVVDLADLTEALRAREIAGAGMDVFEIEPLPRDHPLWDMPNVIITPHCAAASPRVSERHLQTLLENLRRFAAGQPVTNVVDKTRWF